MGLGERKMGFQDQAIAMSKQFGVMLILGGSTLDTLAGVQETHSHRKAFLFLFLESMYYCWRHSCVSRFPHATECGDATRAAPHLPRYSIHSNSSPLT